MRQHVVTIVTGKGRVSTVALNENSEDNTPERFIAEAVSTFRRSTALGFALPLTIHYSEHD